MRLVAVKRGLSTVARSPMRSSPLSHALHNWARKISASLRNAFPQRGVQYTRLNRLFAKLPAQVFQRSTPGSQILRGALSAFKTTTASSTSASRSAYARLGSPFVTFARGASSGLGARPAFGSLAISPMRGGLGLQSARNFSSGGARIFDNLIVNAPLALRLAGDEAEQKAKLLARAPTRSPRRATPAGPRRTGATFSTANLARNALRFATQQAHKPASVATTEAILEQTDGSRYTATEKQKAISTDLDTYFELPALPCEPVSATMTIRLTDPLYEALGGRDPLPFDITRAEFGATLFDAPLHMDVSAVVEHEHVRYMQAKALLRVLWAHNLLGPHGSMDLFSDPERWHVSLAGITPAAVRAVLDANLTFDYRSWVLFEGESNVSSRQGSLASTPLNSSPPSTSESDTSFILDASPPLSSSSLFSDLSFDGPPSESSLFDSRDFA